MEEAGEETKKVRGLGGGGGGGGVLRAGAHPVSLCSLPAVGHKTFSAVTYLSQFNVPCHFRDKDGGLKSQEVVMLNQNHVLCPF